MVCLDVQQLKNEQYGQGHLVEGYDSWTIQQKDAFQKDIDQCEANYPGGILNYVERARKLLEDSSNDVNPFEGFHPEVPLTSKLVPGTQSFDDLESIGLENADGLAFVLVAGGLGERLGFDGIKLSLPTECTTNTCYLQLYCEYILAFQAIARKNSGNNHILLPLAIMTSDDTYLKTVDLLKANSNFDLVDEQITIMKQEKVPALKDSDARIAQDPITKRLEMKPHGHGDVHSLLVQHGLPAKWVAEGRRYMLFFQDTNALVFRCLPSTLGVSVKQQLAMNTICISRKAGEAVGGICRLMNKETGHEVTINVEYNQLGPLLKAAGQGGDLPDENGNSSFPGNTNALLFDLKRYQTVMKESGGNIPEFVNPKYSDDTKTSFKSPTRLECMMQEYPRLLTKDDKVGCVEAPRWLSFSTVKNHYSDAAKKVDSGGVPESAFSGEADLYSSNVALLKLVAKSKKAEFEIEDPEEMEFLGVKYPLGARVVLKPAFGVCIADMKDRILQGSNIKISRDSTLVIEGPATLNGLELDGTMVVKGQEARMIENVVRKTDKAQMVTPPEGGTPIYRIRGYKIELPECSVFN